MIYREFNWIGIQPVVLCAGLQSDVDQFAHESRFFLQVAGKPLLYYVLQTLENSKFPKHSEIIVAVPKDKEEEVQRLPEKYNLGMSLNVRGFSEDDCSTASILKTLQKEKLLKAENVLILPGDLIGEIDLLSIIEQHYAKYATVTSVYSGIPPDVKVPGQKTNPVPETDLVGIDTDSLRIVLLNGEKIKRETLVKHPHVELKKLCSAFTYCFRTCALDYLLQVDYDDFEDFICCLVKEQFSDLEGKDGEIFHADEGYSSVMELSSTYKRDFSSGSLSCYAFLLNTDCHRVNSLQNYVRTTRQMTKGMSEGTAIADSSVGENCTIKERVRIVNSVLTHHVTVEESSSLTDCLVFHDAVIGRNSHLKDCLVGALFSVPPGTKATNETFEIDDF